MNNTVEPQILYFQARYTAILQYHRNKLVRPEQYKAQECMLADIWHVGRLGNLEALRSDNGMERPSGGGERNLEGWSRLGLGLDGEETGKESHSELELFRDVGELGLECLVR
jgi:engulfment/cell motility protein 1